MHWPRCASGWAPGWARGIISVAAIAAITIGGTFGAQTNQHHVRRLDALGVMLLAVICLAIMLRRRKPPAMLLIVAVGVCAYFGIGYPWGPVFLPLTIALGGAVLAGYRLLAWISSGVIYAFIVWGGFYLGGLGHRPHLAGAFEVAAWPLLILIGAEVLRSGRERAQSAAHGREELSRRRESEERLRIAQELHDVLAHNISLISVQAGVALHLMDERPDKAADQARTALTAIRQASKEALGELRSVLGLLRSPASEHAPLSPVPGMAQLSDLTSRASAAGLTVRTEVAGDERPLPADTDLAAYRIVQEALTNVIRHAGATTVTVRVSYGAASLGVEVEDDGRGTAARPRGPGARGGPGADASATTRQGSATTRQGNATTRQGNATARQGNATTGQGNATTGQGSATARQGSRSGPDAGGNGIAGMRERARLLGGELTAHPLPGSGFLVRARLPIRRGAARVAAAEATS